MAAAASATSRAGVLIDNRSSAPVLSIAIQSRTPLSNGKKYGGTGEFVTLVNGEEIHSITLMPRTSGRPVFHGFSLGPKCVFDVSINLSPGTKYLRNQNLCAGKPIVVTDADRAFAPRPPAPPAEAESADALRELTPLDAPSWEYVLKNPDGELGYVDTDRISGDAATKFITYKQVKPADHWAAVVRSRISCASWTYQALEAVEYRSDGSHHFLKMTQPEKPIKAGTVMDGFAKRVCG